MLIVQVLVLLAMTFLVLIGILRWFMGRHLTTATAHLQGLSQDYLRRQDELKKRLEEAERNYQEQITKAQEEAQQLKSQALAEAEAARRQAMDHAHEEAERIVKQANQARESLQRELSESMDARAIERACELLRDAMPPELREAAHRQWFEALLHNGLVTGQQLQAGERVKEARVVAAFALTDAQRKLLNEKLAAALGGPVTLQESVDAKLIAGLTITVGHLGLDGSLGSKLEERARQIKPAGAS